LGQIDSATGTVDVDFYLRYRWKDPHTAEVKDSPDMTDKAWWNPNLEVLNRTDLDSVGETALIDKEYICREIRFRGNVRCKMPLHDFPFDTQKLVISIESNEWNNEVLQLEPWNNLNGEPFIAEISEHPEFEIMRHRQEVIDHQYPYSLIEGEDKGEVFSQYNFVLTVERRSGYYISKIGAVFAMCLVCSWSIFFMDPSDIGNRLGIFTTLFLTAVAFQYVVNEKLPNIPYLTKLDHLVNGCYTLLLLSGVEIVIIYQSWNNGMDQETLFHSDMIAFALLAAPALGLGIWFKVLQLRHEEDHVVTLKKKRDSLVSSPASPSDTNS